MTVEGRCTKRRMAGLIALFLGLTPGLWTAAFADVIPEIPSVAVATPAGVVPAVDEAYETPGILRAEDLLPDYLLSGDLFYVEPEVRNDGETNHYVVRSALGDAEVAGQDELAQAIQEIRALDLLNDASKRTGATVGFNQGVKSLATSPYRNVKRVVFNPLYAIEAVPTEIADYAGKIATVSDLFKYGPVVFVRRSVGIDGARKDLAKRLGVDSGTDNEALQEEIKRVGWGVWVGGIVPKVGDGYLDLSIDLSTEVGDLGEGNLGRAVDAIRREVYPRAAWRLLKKLDVPKDLSKSFRDNPNYHGRMCENLATALLTMEKTEGRIEFVAWANSAKNESEARQAVRLAQVMAVGNAVEEPIARIRSRGDVLLFETEYGKAVSLLPFDYLIWSASAADHVQRAEDLKGEIAPNAPLEIWATGEVSPRFRDAMTEQGHTVRTNLDEAYPRFERPRQGLGGLEQQYERRVEEPIKDDITDRLPVQRKQRLALAPLGPESTTQ